MSELSPMSLLITAYKRENGTTQGLPSLVLETKRQLNLTTTEAVAYLVGQPDLAKIGRHLEFGRCGSLLLSVRDRKAEFAAFLPTYQGQPNRAISVWLTQLLGREVEGDNLMMTMLVKLRLDETGQPGGMALPEWARKFSAYARREGVVTEDLPGILSVCCACLGTYAKYHGRSGFWRLREHCPEHRGQPDTLGEKEADLFPELIEIESRFPRSTRSMW